MRLFSLAALAIVVALLAPHSASAQPVLQRVEQLLRGQSPTPAAQNPATPPGAIEPGYLGLTADDSQDRGRGVRVTNLVAGGPAAAGGVKVGDLITAINNQPIQGMEDMAKVLERQTAGTRINVATSRNGSIVQNTITLGRRPPSAPIGRLTETLPTPPMPSSEGDPQPTPARPKLGVVTHAVTAELARAQSLNVDKGVWVERVTPGGAAEKAGIPVNAVIGAVDGQAVNSPEELAEAMRRGTPKGLLNVNYLIDGKSETKLVRLEAPPPTSAAPPVNPPTTEVRARPISPPPPLPDAEEAPLFIPGAQAPTAPTPVTPAPAAPRAAPPAPAAPPMAVPRPGTASLEDRIRELEARIEKLEAELQKRP